MQLKRYGEAIAIFKSILKQTPNSDRIHYYLGSLYEETKQYEDAIAELKLIEPESKLFQDAALHVALALAAVAARRRAREAPPTETR